MILGRDYVVRDAKGQRLGVGLVVDMGTGDADIEKPGVVVAIGEPDESHPRVEVLWPEAKHDTDTEWFGCCRTNMEDRPLAYRCDDLEVVADAA